MPSNIEGKYIKLRADLSEITLIVGEQKDCF